MEEGRVMKKGGGRKKVKREDEGQTGNEERWRKEERKEGRGRKDG